MSAGAKCGALYNCVALIKRGIHGFSVSEFRLKIPPLFVPETQRVLTS